MFTSSSISESLGSNLSSTMLGKLFSLGLLFGLDFFLNVLERAVGYLEDVTMDRESTVIFGMSGSNSASYSTNHQYSFGCAARNRIYVGLTYMKTLKNPGRGKSMAFKTNRG